MRKTKHWLVIKMFDLVSSDDVKEKETRNTKKTLLPTDAICVKCGAIFNNYYEDQCIMCNDDDHIEEMCDHKEFITGRESVDLRILLDYRMEDLQALAELHGCAEGGSRGRITIKIMEKLHSSLDKRIDDNLIRKMIKRNNRKFRFWTDIEGAIYRAKKSWNIALVSADDCIEIPEFGKDGKV